MTAESLKSQDRKDDNKNIDDIIAKNERAIKQLYDMYREMFVRYFTKTYSIQETDAAEIYQESFLAMYQNVVNGKVTTITSSLKTYLFRIGKHKIYNHFRDAKPTTELHSSMSDTDSEDGESIQKVVNEVVFAMENPCSRLLRLFYWERKSMKEIAGIMNYKNEQVAKNRKSNCMKKLKERLIARLKEDGLM